MNSNLQQLAFAVDATVPPTRFIASISDGTTVYENHLNDPNLQTPWMRLKQYLNDTGKHLTKLRMQGGGETTNLPVADAYMIFYQANLGPGIFSQNYLGVGMFDSQNEKLTVLFYQSDGKINRKEVRNCKSDHPALIFLK